MTVIAAHIFRALGTLCILPCPPVLWAFNMVSKGLCLLPYEIGHLCFLVVLLVFCGQQGGKNMFYQFSHLAAQFKNPSKC